MTAPAGFCGRHWGVLLCADMHAKAVQAWMRGESGVRSVRSLLRLPFAATPLLLFLYPYIPMCISLAWQT